MYYVSTGTAESVWIRPTENEYVKVIPLEMTAYAPALVNAVDASVSYLELEETATMANITIQSKNSKETLGVVVEEGRDENIIESRAVKESQMKFNSEPNNNELIKNSIDSSSRSIRYNNDDIASPVEGELKQQPTITINNDAPGEINNEATTPTDAIIAPASASSASSSAAAAAAKPSTSFNLRLLADQIRESLSITNTNNIADIIRIAISELQIQEGN